MLHTLYNGGDLYFDFERGKWHFNIPDEATLPANVVELIMRDLQHLPKETQNVLKLAACIGSNRFSLFLLSIVYQHSLEETAKDLWPALKAGLVVPTSNAYQIPLAIEPGSDLSQQWTNNSLGLEPAPWRQLPMDKYGDHASNSSKRRRRGNLVVSYRSAYFNFPNLGFLHDRVQHSAVELIPESERPDIYYLIGKHLLHRMSADDQLDQYVFEICAQLYRAQERLTPEEHEQLIKLSLQAGRKALKATAYEDAVGYFRVARELVGEKSWVKRRRVTLDVYLANVESLLPMMEFDKGVRR
jgi:predicted ATPase